MAEKLDIALLTCSNFPTLQKDYRPLVNLLTDRGFSVKPLVWNDPDINWRNVRNVVVCSVWDYCQKLADFNQFLNCTLELSNVINPREIITWNINKTYLKNFEKAGIPIIPTLWLDAHSDFDEIEKFQNKDIVIKPAIGAGSSGMKRFKLNCDEALSCAKDYALSLAKAVTCMVQPYLESADTNGETALVLFDGKLSHAAHRPVAGHQGTPDQEIETASYVEASKKQIEIADKVVSCLPVTPAYLRIDFLKDNEGADVVLEAEMIEPTLFFEVYPRSIETYAEALSQNHIVN